MAFGVIHSVIFPAIFPIDSKIALFKLTNFLHDTQAMAHHFLSSYDLQSDLQSGLQSDLQSDNEASL